MKFKIEIEVERKELVKDAISAIIYALDANGWGPILKIKSNKDTE